MQLQEDAGETQTTIMPVVSAAEVVGPPFFVFKEKWETCRQVLQNGEVLFQTQSSRLQRGAFVAMWEDVGGVDSANFYNWAQVFVAIVRDLTPDGRKVLLTYDAYRAYMALRVLELFKANNIVVYAIPAHTSEKTQPCEVVLFCDFQSPLNEAMSRLVDTHGVYQLKLFKYCSILRSANHTALTRHNIVAAFRGRGCGPEPATPAFHALLAR